MTSQKATLQSGSTLKLARQSVLKSFLVIFLPFVTLWTMFTRTQRVPNETKTRLVQGAGLMHKLIMFMIWKPIIKVLVEMKHYLYGTPEKFRNELMLVLKSGEVNLNIDFSGHDQAITWKRQAAHILKWLAGIPPEQTMSITMFERSIRRFGRKKKTEIIVSARVFGFCVALFNLVDIVQGTIVSPLHFVEGYITGVKSGDFLTSGKGSEETTLYVKATQDRTLIERFIKEEKVKIGAIPDLVYEYAKMGDDIIAGMSNVQYKFWSVEIPTPRSYRPKPGDVRPEKIAFMNAFLSFYFGAIVNIDKSDVLVKRHVMVLKKEGLLLPDGTLLVAGLIGPIINSLARVERDSSIFNSELFREMFSTVKRITESEALLLRNIAVLYNVRNGSYLKVLIAALYFGDEDFAKWINQPQSVRDQLFKSIRITPVEWRIASQSEWDAFVLTLYEEVRLVIGYIEHPTTKPEWFTLTEALFITR